MNGVDLCELTVLGLLLVNNVIGLFMPRPRLPEMICESMRNDMRNFAASLERAHPR